MVNYNNLAGYKALAQLQQQPCRIYYIALLLFENVEKGWLFVWQSVVVVTMMIYIGVLVD